MKSKILKAALLLITIVLGATAYAQSEIVPAKGKFNSRFLIVIDKASFSAAKQEVLDYKAVLESEGLGAMILAGEWNDPEILREEIRDIYNQKPVLEGAVFIGNIPVVRVQNFQHSTTAFKMDEANFPITDASVTSDRFYDDLDLEFELIKQDEKNPGHFYYRLLESSPQVIDSDFYSARMLPPSDMGIEPVVLLKRYLKKVVTAHKESNPMDQLVIFNGHGYNSDCLTAWQNEQFAIREQVPLAFKSSKGNGFYNFRQDPFMKYKLYDKMQQNGTDLFVFHEHGDFDTQYINGDYPAPNYIEYTAGGNLDKIGPMSVMGTSLRNTYRRYKGERAEKFKKELMADYGFTEEFFARQRLDSLRVSDSIFAADINIVLKDLAKVKMQPKFTIFDACYNGSFHKPGYVAGYHIFGDGNTIVTQGNTVNVLQDKWTLELIGMLAEGARVGFWQKEFQYLESHLIGDPTYHFYAEGSKALNRNLAIDVSNTAAGNKGNTNKGNTKVWEKYLRSSNPNLQALALKQLSKNPPKDFSDILLNTFKSSKHFSVRFEALKRLLDNVGGEGRDYQNMVYQNMVYQNMVEAIRLGLDDPYEFIRRFAARFAGYSGDPVLIPSLVSTALFSNESQRVQYAAQGSLQMFDIPSVVNEIERQAKASNLPDKEKVAKDLGDYYKGQLKLQEKSLRTILDKNAKQENRISAIRSLRNYNNHKQTGSLLGVLSDSTDNTAVRTTLAEALGWFNLSITKVEIIKALTQLHDNPGTPPELKKEALQSLNRLL